MQLERLANALHEEQVDCDRDYDGTCVAGRHDVLAGALLARGVRNVSASDYVSPARLEQPSLTEPVSFGLNGLETTFKVSFHRHERQRCANCAKRRIVFDVGLGDLIASPRICARCAGIR